MSVNFKFSLRNSELEGSKKVQTYCQKEQTEVREGLKITNKEKVKTKTYMGERERERKAEANWPGGKTVGGDV